MANGSIDFSDEEEEQLFRDVLQGKTHLFNLPANLYNRLASELTKGVLNGFQLEPDVNLLNPDLVTPLQMKRNVYVFSAAKTFQQIKDMQNFIFNEKGFKRSFNEFKQAAKEIFDTYNVNWLEAEFETATRQAEGAAEWGRFEEEADIFPLLRYKTLEDGSVRDEHATLNNIVQPVNSTFWSTYNIPNGWRCRCYIEQLEEGEAPITEIKKGKGGGTLKKVGRTFEEVEQPTKLFNFNPAKEEIVFREDAKGKGITSHPYFKVDKRFDVHKRNNFGLPLPPDVVKGAKPPKVKRQKVVIQEEQGFKPATTIAEAVNFAVKNKLAKKINYKGGNLTQVNAINEAIFEAKNKTKAGVIDIREIRFDESLNSTARAGTDLVINPLEFSTNESILARSTSASDISRLEKRILRKQRSIDNLNLSTEELKRVKKDINDTLKEIKKLEQAPNSYVARNLKDIITHETGHFVEETLNELNPYSNEFLASIDSRDKAGVKWENILLSKMEIIAKNKGSLLSQYSTTNGEEYFAESWTEFIKNPKTKKVDKRLLSVFKKVIK